MDRQRFSFAWSALLGFDIFISYRRSDGSAYAEKLWRDLKAAGITPFLDRAETPGGAQLTPSLVRALRRSKMLLILLTPQVLDSEWVQQEVETFSKFRGRAIVPINIDNFIARHKLDGTRLAGLKDYSWIEETREGLETGVPSETVLAEINKGFRKVRVRSISRSIVAAVMLALAATAVTAFVQMRRAQREAEIALASQTAAQAELIRAQDDSQSDLAATLALDSFERNPSPQAEQTLRAALESLPVQLASFQTEGVTDIGFAPDGSGILTYGSKSGKARLYALSGKLIREFGCAPPDVCEIAVEAGAAAVAGPQEGGGSTIRILDLASGRNRETLQWGDLPVRMVLDARAQTMGAVTAQGKACVWRVPESEAPVCINGPAKAMWKMNANGRLLASRLEDEDDDEKVTYQIWNTQTGAEVMKTGGWISMSPTGRYAVVTSGSTRAQVRDLDKSKDLPDFPHEETVDGAVFDATEQFMATSSSAYRLRLWLLTADRPETPIVTTVAPANRRLRGFTADGLGLVTEADNPRRGADLLFWRLRSRGRLLDLVPRQRIHHEDSIYAIAAHADGFTYATLDDKGMVRVWDTSDGNLVSLVRHENSVEEPTAAQACRQTGSSWTARLRSLIPARKTAAFDGPDLKTAAAVDPCGRYFATTSKISAGRDPQTVYVYSTATHQEVARIAHSANVNSVAFSVDGRYLLTGGEDHAIKVWDLEQQRPATSVEMETEVRSVRLSDDGRQIIAVGEKDAFERYPVATYIWWAKDLVSAMEARQIRRLNRDEWARYLGSRMPLRPSR